MNANGPVLRDIHLPPASWWPPAPGWWLLAALLVASAAGIAWWRWQRRRSRGLRAALLEIDRIAATFAREWDAAAVAIGTSHLLRRIALRIEPAAAASCGAEWRAFLRRHARDTQTAVRLEDLADTAFRPRPVIDPGATLTALRIWCRDALPGRGARRGSTTPPKPSVSVQEPATP